jgi:hypothetical protein
MTPGWHKSPLGRRQIYLHGAHNVALTKKVAHWKRLAVKQLGPDLSGVEGQRRDKFAGSVVNGMYRTAWERFCAARSLVEYRYLMTSGFHAGPAAAKIGRRIAWGMQGDRRSSMLRNEAKGHVWQFGVTARRPSGPISTSSSRRT